MRKHRLRSDRTHLQNREKDWQAGSDSGWAKESFQIAKGDAWGLLGGPSSRGTYRQSDDYVTTATDDVAQHLSRAGVRLAFVLNKAWAHRVMATLGRHCLLSA